MKNTHIAKLDSLSVKSETAEWDLIVKDNQGRPAPSPFVQLAGNYLRQSNDAWAKIYAVVRETRLTDWDSKTPHDDVMEKLLGGK